MKSKVNYYPAKSKKKNIKVIYNRKPINWMNNKIIIVSVLGSIILLGLTYLSFLYFDTQNKISRLIKSQEYPEAIQLINQLLQENPNDSFALRAKGTVYHLLSLNEKDAKKTIEFADVSISYLKKLVETKDSENIKSDVFFFLGYNFFLKGSEFYSEALDFLKKSLNLDANDEMTTNYLNNNGFKVRYDNGNNYFSASLYGLLGYISYQLGLFEESIQYFNKAVTEKKAASMVHFLLASAYAKYSSSKDFEDEELDKIYDQMLKELEIVNHQENRPKVLYQSNFLLFQIYFIRKDYVQAERALKEAQKMDNTAESYYQLGILYEKQNQLDKAIQFWQEAIKIEPDHDKAQFKLIKMKNFAKTNKKEEKKKK